MTKTRAELTELEGAILGVIRLDPSCTAYRVRQVFLASRSAEWSGSAGAVYPAIRRLEARGLIGQRAEKEDGRGTHTYRLNPAGAVAHDRWLCDQTRAIGPGLDPFRTRAGFWSVLPARQRQALLRRLKVQIEQRRRDLLEEFSSLDDNDAAMSSLHVALLETRLKWIASQL